MTEAQSEDARYLIWQTRLRESLALLDEALGTPCECREVRRLNQLHDPKSRFILIHYVPNAYITKMYHHGTCEIAPDATCIQCYARKVLEDGQASTSAIKGIAEEVLCRIDDSGEVEFTEDHPVEAIRYWLNPTEAMEE